MNLIVKKVEDNGIVVWYDPDQVYTRVVNDLTVSATTVLRKTYHAGGDTYD